MQIDHPSRLDSDMDSTALWWIKNALYDIGLDDAYSERNDGALFYTVENIQGGIMNEIAPLYTHDKSQDRIATRRTNIKNFKHTIGITTHSLTETTTDPLPRQSCEM